MNIAVSSKTKRKVKKYLSTQFAGKTLVWLFRALFLVGISYVILYPIIIKLSAAFLSKKGIVAPKVTFLIF